MSIKYREDSIMGIRKREAQRTKVAESAVLTDGSIHLTLPEGHVCDGTMVKFCAPCTCDKVTGGIVIDGETYTVVGPMLNCITGIGGVWDAGAQLSVVIDKTAHRAFLQKAVVSVFPVQIPLSWTADATNGGYYTTVSVDGILASDAPDFDILLGADIDANALYLEAWGAITRAVANAGSITIYANGDKPTTAFTMQVKVVR